MVLITLSKHKQMEPEWWYWFCLWETNVCSYLFTSVDALTNKVVSAFTSRFPRLFSDVLQLLQSFCTPGRLSDRCVWWRDQFVVRKNKKSSITCTYLYFTQRAKVNLEHPGSIPEIRKSQNKISNTNNYNLRTEPTVCCVAHIWVIKRRSYIVNSIFLAF